MLSLACSIVLAKCCHGGIGGGLSLAISTINCTIALLYTLLKTLYKWTLNAILPLALGQTSTSF